MSANVVSSRKAARPSRRSSGVRFLGACAVAAAVYKAHSAFTAAPQAVSAPVAKSAVSLRASPVSKVSNPIKTVSQSVADFYKAYPSPPVLPMYRTFIIDALTSAHLAIVDSRFKYDSIFALGLEEYYNGLMGSYDKLMGGSEEAPKIWKAFCAGLDLDSEKVSADAEAARKYGADTSPADILKQMEGSEGPMGEAFKSIRSGLYSQPFSIGLFTLMDKAGVETSKANVEEWAKALEITPAKASSDLETYKLNQKKLQNAEEMIREVEIREKKKLAQRLEEKAKALAAKAGAKEE